MSPGVVTQDTPRCTRENRGFPRMFVASGVNAEVYCTEWEADNKAERSLFIVPSLSPSMMNKSLP